MKRLALIVVAWCWMASNSLAWQVGPGYVPEPQVTKMLQLKHVDAETLDTVLQLYESDLGTVLEPKSNTLFLRGPADVVEESAKILQQLEEARANPSGAVKLENKQQSASIATDSLRKEYEALEQQSLKLAEKLRQSQSSDETDQQELTELVRRSFEARQKLQRAQVAESAQRIEKVRQMIEAREGLKAQIVKRRVGELIHPKVDPVDKTQKPNEATGEEVGYGTTISATKTNSNSTENSFDLFRSSPAQIHDLLWDLNRNIRISRVKIEEVEDELRKKPEDEGLLNELKQRQDTFRHHEGRLSLLISQYHEVIAYLEAARASIEQRVKIAQEDHDRMVDLFTKNSATRTEVNAALMRLTDVQLERQRNESQLKLYRAAGEGM